MWPSGTQRQEPWVLAPTLSPASFEAQARTLSLSGPCQLVPAPPVPTSSLIPPYSWSPKARGDKDLCRTCPSQKLGRDPEGPGPLPAWLCFYKVTVGTCKGRTHLYSHCPASAGSLVRS